MSDRAGAGFGCRRPLALNADRLPREYHRGDNQAFEYEFIR
jgi:hypothetical protein